MKFILLTFIFLITSSCNRGHSEHSNLRSSIAVLGELVRNEIKYGPKVENAVSFLLDYDNYLGRLACHTAKEYMPLDIQKKIQQVIIDDERRHRYPKDKQMMLKRLLKTP